MDKSIYIRIYYSGDKSSVFSPTNIVFPFISIDPWVWECDFAIKVKGDTYVIRFKSDGKHKWLETKVESWVKSNFIEIEMFMASLSNLIGGQISYLKPVPTKLQSESIFTTIDSNILLMDETDKPIEDILEELSESDKKMFMSASIVMTQTRILKNRYGKIGNII